MILATKLLIYECEGTEPEIKQWFRTINISGVALTNQELLNAVYSGPFVTLGKEEFSNSLNANIQKWGAYISGSANRQDFLERALEWVSKGKIDDYMSRHRFDTNIKELKNYFILYNDSCGRYWLGIGCFVAICHYERESGSNENGTLHGYFQPVSSFATVGSQF